LMLILPFPPLQVVFGAVVPEIVIAGLLFVNGTVVEAVQPLPPVTVTV
jgi:hypothetical protein